MNENRVELLYNNGINSKTSKYLELYKQIGFVTLEDLEQICKVIEPPRQAILEEFVQTPISRRLKGIENLDPNENNIIGLVPNRFKFDVYSKNCDCVSKVFPLEYPYIDSKTKKSRNYKTTELVDAFTKDEVGLFIFIKKSILEDRASFVSLISSRDRKLFEESLEKIIDTMQSLKEALVSNDTKEIIAIIDHIHEIFMNLRDMLSLFPDDSNEAKKIKKQYEEVLLKVLPKSLDFLEKHSLSEYDQDLLIKINNDFSTEIMLQTGHTPLLHYTKGVSLYYKEKFKESKKHFDFMKENYHEFQEHNTFSQYLDLLNAAKQTDQVKDLLNCFNNFINEIKNSCKEFADYKRFFFMLDSYIKECEKKEYLTKTEEEFAEIIEMRFEMIKSLCNISIFFVKKLPYSNSKKLIQNYFENYLNIYEQERKKDFFFLRSKGFLYQLEGEFAKANSYFNLALDMLSKEKEPKKKMLMKKYKDDIDHMKFNSGNNK